MDREDGVDQAGRSQAAVFARALDALKRRGSSLLLVGPGHHTATSTACNRLLGADVSEPRRRLFVVTDGAGAAHRPQPTPGDRQSVRTIAYETPMRSAAVTAPAAASASVRHVTGGLDDLYAVIEDEADQIAEDVGGLDPAELRVCIDSIDVLLERHGEEAVFEFLHALAGTMRRVGGMCHVHLPTQPGAESARLLSPLFDAVIEVQNDSDGPHQRWHLREQELTTDWLPL